jgi:FkbM family methyltransferase
MLIEVSEGEILDRLSILEIKQSNIKDETRLVEVKKEIQTLSFINDAKEKYHLYYSLLHYVNICIWNMTDEIKILTTYNNIYAEKSFHIFEWNQQRFRMKNIINQLSNSTIKEQKSYAKLVCIYEMTQSASIMEVLCTLFHLILNYDCVKLLENKYSSQHIEAIRMRLQCIEVVKESSHTYEHLLSKDIILDQSVISKFEEIIATIYYYRLPIYQSYSQFGQDLFVINHIYDKKRNGYFVEVGASEGIGCSNSLLLEKEYGWNGICVECNPKHLPTLKKVRRCNISTAAVFNENDLELTFYDSNIGGHSGLVDTITNNEVKNYSNVIVVKTKTLTTILEENNAPSFIEYLSLDTEGSELSILEAHDFERYKFGYMCIEHNNIEKNRSAIRLLLESKGYTFYRQNGVDDDYILSTLLPVMKENTLTIYNPFHGEFLCKIYVDQAIRVYFPHSDYKGVFFEVGAFDPIVISNSYHFERNGWNCHLFEANPNLISKLKSHRKNVYNYAIYDEDKSAITFNVVHNGSWTAGYSAIDLSEEYTRIFPCNTKTVQQISVSQKTLHTIIEREIPYLTHIDIVSLDVEGGELKVLKGLQLDKHHVKLFVIENVNNDPSIQAYLSTFNYVLHKQIAYNQFYIHKIYCM